jgi:Transposase
MLFVGDDWAEDHHDVYLMNDTGAKLASRRLPEGLAGMRVFHELVAAHAEDPAEAVIGIETDRGLWVDALTAAGYRVFAVNPWACQDNCVNDCGRLSLGHSGSRSGNWMAKVLSA